MGICHGGWQYLSCSGGNLAIGASAGRSLPSCLIGDITKIMQQIWMKYCKTYEYVSSKSSWKLLVAWQTGLPTV